ncbi:hypothetical protein BCR43DRAFT_483868 [Syncephalastrum racemosum]|uniref:Uncharacterized protein n=1 Tax=Syncephalastrum racemosum TaxID=13706 RepID=A0A1X2HVY5_SYNRA|nr:hypothetical protein BCR43DRAFT_483868 [Syncephalastrum racemosum]
MTLLVRAAAKSVASRTQIAATRTYATAKPKRRVGGFRGGLLGFLLGSAACVAVSDQFVQDDFIHSTRQLAASVDELRKQTEKVREYADIVERVDRDFTRLKTHSISSEDLERLKRDIFRLHDLASHEHVNLRDRVWDVEKQMESAL